MEEELRTLQEKMNDFPEVLKMHLENYVLIDPKYYVVMIGQTEDKIAIVVSDYSPDIVAISVLFSNLLESAHINARLIKKVKKNTKAILGGNHISSAVTDYKISLIDNYLIWELFAHDWALEGLDKITKEVSLDNLEVEIESILSGNQVGRVLVKI